MSLVCISSQTPGALHKRCPIKIFEHLPELKPKLISPGFRYFAPYGQIPIIIGMKYLRQKIA